MAIIGVQEFARALRLMVVWAQDNHKIEILTSDTSRPGLHFAGYFNYFSQERIQLIGMLEMSYLLDLEPAVREERLERYCASGFPCIVICRNLTPPVELVRICAKYEKPLFISTEVTTAFQHQAMAYLENLLAPRETTHGVLLDVYGVGIMLAGNSGIGKSETALELIKRGHRLVADDAVEIRRVSNNRVVGESPPLIQHLMELRGVGIIDVKNMYGVGAVIRSKTIDLIIRMEHWDAEKIYDRLGNVDEYTELLGVRIPQIKVPVAPGRNLAIIVEVAAMNFRLKGMGYHAVEELDRRLEQQIQTRSAQQEDQA